MFHFKVIREIWHRTENDSVQSSHRYMKYIKFKYSISILYKKHSVRSFGQIFFWLIKSSFDHRLECLNGNCLETQLTVDFIQSTHKTVGLFAKYFDSFLLKLKKTAFIVNYWSTILDIKLLAKMHNKFNTKISWNEHFILHALMQKHLFVCKSIDDPFMCVCEAQTQRVCHLQSSFIYRWQCGDHSFWICVC